MTLDYGLDRPLTTASYAFVMPNPYSNVSYFAGVGVSFAGLPAIYISGAGYYSWIQSRGRCWISDIGSSLGKTNYGRELVFGANGGVGLHLATGNNVPEQHAGFILDNNQSNNGMTEIFIDCDID